MKNLIINRILQFYIVFIFLCVPFSTKSQTNEFDRGDSYLQSFDFANAAVEYERVIYQNPSLQIMNRALFKKAFCYKQLGDFQKASETIERVRLFALTEEEQAEYYYERILCYYLSGSFREAEVIVDDMYLNITHEEYLHNTLLMQVFVYNELNQWDKAKQKAMEWSFVFFEGTERDSVIHAVEKVYAQIPRLKKEKLVNVLAFFPGLGHLYAGKPIEGFVSFFLNAGVLTFGVYQAWHTYYVTAYLGGAGILAATYFGSSDRAKYLVKQHNYKVSKAFNEQIKENLLRF